MYSETLKCIFVHIYKTGGTSIEHALRRFTIPQPKHLRANLMREAMGEKRWNSCFKFSIVRNPWDRMLSSYSYRLMRGYTTPDVTFEEFVLGFDKHENQELFRITQQSWLVDSENKIIVDMVARFERLDEEWKKIQKRLLINIPLPHLNKTQHGNYQSYYTTETQKAVEDRFQKDVEAFGYTFK